MTERKWTFDYKKEYKDLYMPQRSPSIVKVPLMNYIAVRGKGSPDVSGTRHHHEIYLSNPGKVAAEKRKTVIRHPII